MPSPLDSHHRSIIAQFRVRYPTASLVSEFLQVHQDQYLVRVAVQQAGTTLATGLAAAPDIEQAEDRARARALEMLGISPATTLPDLPAKPALALKSSTSGVDSSLAVSRESLDPPFEDGIEFSFEDGDVPSLPPDDPEPFPVSSLPQATNGAVSHSPETDLNQLLETAAAPIPPSSLGSPTPIAPVPNSASPPLDLSDIIAETDLEMRRIGWGRAQGRSYLIETYGKKTRQELDDDELVEFLTYLKAQPSASS